MNVGDLVDVYDGDLKRWVECRLDSTGPLTVAGVLTEVRVFMPIDESLLDEGSGLRLIYGIPWPAGERITRPTQPRAQ